MKHINRWGGKYILLFLFLSSWYGSYIYTAREVRKDAKTHGETVTQNDIWVAFLDRTFENWQSEFLQLLCAALLATYVLTKLLNQSDSAADKDDVQRIIDEINKTPRKDL